MRTITEPQTEPNTPLVARFAAVRYELSPTDTDTIPPLYASGKGIFGTDPTTYSATTKRGDDNDTDDTGAD